MICAGLLLIGLSSCAGVKVVHIPIPIPTFGLGGGKAKDQKTVISNDPEDRVILQAGEAKGLASWYGPKFHRKQTASGERYNMYALTAAHRTLPFDTKVLVTNVKNGKETVVRINDRGPFVNGRIIDVSRAAARELAFENDGVTEVHIQVMN
jgi:rare lipoprotein A